MAGDDTQRPDPDAQAMRNLIATATLADELYRDPETRADFQKLIVRKHGDKAKALMPDYAMRDEATGVLDEVKKERAAIDARFREFEQRDTLTRARREIMDDPELRITEAEIPDVEKLMTDEKLGPIGNHKAAARLFRSLEQHVATSSGYRAGIDWPTKSTSEDYKGITEDSEGWARRRAEQVLNDIRSGNGARWGA